MQTLPECYFQTYRQVRLQLNVYAEFFGKDVRLDLNMPCAITPIRCYQRFYDFNSQQHVQ